MARVVIIIPAYREATRVGAAVSAVRPFADAVVVVDDGSPDATQQAAHAAGAWTLRHQINRGQGAALQTGVTFALAHLSPDILVHFDADGQMDATEIPQMIAPIVEGIADVVLGSRFMGDAQEIPLSRRGILWCARLFTALSSGLWLTDAHNGFRAFSAAAATACPLRMDRMAHATEIIDLLAAQRLRVLERPVTISYTQETLAKGQRLSGAWRILRDIFVHRFLS